MRSQSDAFIDRSCATISRWEWSRSHLDQISESALSRDQTFHSQRSPNCFDLRRGQWKFVLTLHWHDLEPIVKSHQSLPIGLRPPYGEDYCENDGVKFAYTTNGSQMFTDYICGCVHGLSHSSCDKDEYTEIKYMNWAKSQADLTRLCSALMRSLYLRLTVTTTGQSHRWVAMCHATYYATY